ncbi:MAG: hypothetical protein M1816_002879 [Peltula sp. TS41687]|nr:MAG: hypothetical protein M1816_002879 [Peltula sp. TS41687]
MPFRQPKLKPSSPSQPSFETSQDQLLAAPRPSAETPLSSPTINHHDDSSSSSFVNPSSPQNPNNNFSSLHPERSTITLVRSGQQLTDGEDREIGRKENEAIGDRGSQQIGGQAQTQEKKKSMRSLFGFGHTSKESNRQTANHPLPPLPPSTGTTGQGNSTGLGRVVSLRRKDHAGSRQSRYSPTDDQNQVTWALGPSTIATRLAPSPETEEGERPLIERPNIPAAFSVQTQDDVPPPPIKDRHPARPGVLQSFPSKETQRPYPQQRGLSESQPSDAIFSPPPRQSSFNQSLHYSQSPRSSISQPDQYQAYQSGLPGNPTLLHQDQQRPDLQHQVLGQTQNEVVPSSQQLPSHVLAQQQFQPSTITHQIPPSQENLRVHTSAPVDGVMGPPPGYSHQARRPGDDQSPGNQGPSSRDGPTNPAYGHAGQGLAPHVHTAHVQSGNRQSMPSSQNQQLRAAPPQPHQSQQLYGDHSRSVSPQIRPRDEAGGAVDLPVYQELQQKYSKVKKLYFEKSAQVEQLQNTLANQRLSQSRTSLDDNEYATRFNRLDGAINNLSFNIRKEWKIIPAWLQPVINDDACEKGTKEMTVVGRACISRWIVDEILERYFHPGIEPTLSVQLKKIEKNLRSLAAPTHSIEEEIALLSKISTWRLTTIDGLQDILSHPQAAEHRNQLTHVLAEKLLGALRKNLVEPPPVGLEGGVAMIVELAVGLAANLHLESRDVFVNYPMPRSVVLPDKVKLETGLPPLTRPVGGVDDTTTDKGSISGADGASQSSESRGDLVDPERRNSDTSSLKDQQAPKKRSMLGGFIGKKSAPSQQTTAGETSMMQQQPSNSGSQASPTQQAQEDGDVQKVRVAAFMSVEVRGRSILVKAPVWTL